MIRPLAFFSFVLLGCTPISISPPSPVADVSPEPIPTPIHNPRSGVINGMVKNSNDGSPIIHAVVVLSCTCLDANEERFTNDRGIYSFTDLPRGNYTIQVLAGKADASKVTELPEGAKFRANFAINPEVEDVKVIVVVEAKPVGSNTSRDFSAVVDLAPTARPRYRGGVGARGRRSHRRP